MNNSCVSAGPGGLKIVILDSTKNVVGLGNRNDEFRACKCGQAKGGICCGKCFMRKSTYPFIFSDETVALQKVFIQIKNNYPESMVWKFKECSLQTVLR